jgi:hypothetical protein
MRNFGMIGPSYTSQSIAVAGERCVNLYPERIETRSGGKAQVGWVLYSTPGLKKFSYFSNTTKIRGIFSTNGRCFIAASGAFWELKSDTSQVYYGAIPDDGLAVTMASNRLQVCIATAHEGWLFDLTTGALAPISDGSGGTLALDQVRFSDGYFIGLTPDSQMIRISGQYDGVTWDPLDFSSAEGDPDNIVAMLCDHREIWTFGEQTTEVWYDSGQADFPYERIPGSFIEQGCAALNSPAKLDNSVFWLGSDQRGNGIVWRAQGYTPIRVSNHAIEYSLSQMATISDAYGFSYQDQGHSFYVLSFPTGNKTWVYDCATGMWHERTYWDTAVGAHQRHRAQCHCFCFGKHLVGDWKTGTIYEQNINYFDDDGEPKKWLRSAPHLSNEMNWTFYADLQVDMEVGKGIPIVSGAPDPGNPQICMRFSDDGGFTWGNEHYSGAGKLGEYRYRVRWAGSLGRSRDRCFEISSAEPIRVALIDAYVQATAGGR